MKPKSVKPMSEAKVEKILKHSSRIVGQAQYELATNFDVSAKATVSHYSWVLGIKPEHFNQVSEAYSAMMDRAFDAIADAVAAKNKVEQPIA